MGLLALAAMKDFTSTIMFANHVVLTIALNVVMQRLVRNAILDTFFIMMELISRAALLAPIILSMKEYVVNKNG